MTLYNQEENSKQRAKRMALFIANIEKEKKRAIGNIEAGQNEYHKDVRSMSDKQLWEHCFADDDIMESDFCVQELKSRFLKTK